MKADQIEPTPPVPWRNLPKQLTASIGAKIVLPYLSLTLVVAGVGAYVVFRLVTASLQERFYNQLLDAGRIVSESMIDFENDRLRVLRAVTATEGVPESLAAGDTAGLAERVPQIIANSNADVVEILDDRGQELYGWQRPPHQPGSSGEERSGADFSQIEDVRLVLKGYVDELGEKRVLLSETPYGLVMFTVGPIYQGENRVGAAMVGSYLEEMVIILSENAVARVSLYSPAGNVLVTTMGGGQASVAEILQEPAEQYDQVLAMLRESPDKHPVVIAQATEEVPLRSVQVLGQEYVLAFGDWRLRGQSFGLFSVGLPSNFIVSTAATSRNFLSLLFSLATVGVFALGLVIARRIIQPLHQLVQTSVAVTGGDLGQRSGIQRNDEIGSLAHSFDLMTDRLVERNRQLVEQASKLEAILNSTADGMIVVDRQGVIMTANPAAQQILNNVSSNFLAEILRELPSDSLLDVQDNSSIDHAFELAKLTQPRRYEVGMQAFSALMAPMRTPDQEILGTVIALRDVSREVEAERLKDGFITNVSHELRTPLTAIKGYIELLLMTHQGNLAEKQLNYVHSINRSANKLLHHINQIIDISEIQSGTLKLHKEAISFSELVEEGVESWRKRMVEKGLSLQLDLSPTQIWVEGDPARLSWAIDNLMDNAYRYTLTGGVQVVLRQLNGEAQLDITDTGVGIDVVDQPYLFTRFFRAVINQSLFDVAGVGLGLYLTRSLIEGHAGRVWFKSRVGVGSTFSLAVPVLTQGTPDEDNFISADA